MRKTNRKKMQKQKREKEFANTSNIRCPRCGGDRIEVLYGWPGTYYDLRCRSCKNDWTINYRWSDGWVVQK